MPGKANMLFADSSVYTHTGWNVDFGQQANKSRKRERIVHCTHTA